MRRFVIVLIPFCTIAASAWAADLPSRKAGLWEMTIENPAMAAAGMAKMTSKQCIDAATDAKMQQMGAENNCRTSNVRRGSGTFSMDVVCKAENTTITSRMTATGDFNTAYVMEVTSRYEPPMHGMAEGSMKISGRHRGACPADLKPGDMVMPNGMKMNVNQMGQMQQGAPR